MQDRKEHTDTKHQDLTTGIYDYEAMCLVNYWQDKILELNPFKDRITISIIWDRVRELMDSITFQDANTTDINQD